MIAGGASAAVTRSAMAGTVIHPFETTCAVVTEGGAHAPHLDPGRETDDGPGEVSGCARADW